MEVDSAAVVFTAELVSMEAAVAFTAERVFMVAEATMARAADISTVAIAAEAITDAAEAITVGAEPITVGAVATGAIRVMATDGDSDLGSDGRMGGDTPMRTGIALGGVHHIPTITHIALQAIHALITATTILLRQTLARNPRTTRRTLRDGLWRQARQTIGRVTVRMMNRELPFFLLTGSLLLQITIRSQTLSRCKSRALPSFQWIG